MIKLFFIKIIYSIFAFIMQKINPYNDQTPLKCHQTHSREKSLTSSPEECTA